MKSLTSESCNVAWFKLADFVARGEKERALNVHKLLMHSVQDKAIAYQLEGDILLAFNDDDAIERYHIAANIYKENNKIKQATAVYEHVSMFKENHKISEALLEIYYETNNENGFLETFSRLAKLSLHKKNFGFIVNKFHHYLIVSNKKKQALLCDHFVIALLLHDPENNQISSYIHQAIDLLCEIGDEKQLQSLLSKIKTLNKDQYKKAENYLANNF